MPERFTHHKQYEHRIEFLKRVNKYLEHRMHVPQSILETAQQYRRELIETYLAQGGDPERLVRPFTR